MSEETCEAVIISGPRKGEIVKVIDDNIIVTPDEEADAIRAFDLLDKVLDSLKERPNESAEERKQRMDAVRREIDEMDAAAKAKAK